VIVIPKMPLMISGLNGSGEESPNEVLHPGPPGSLWSSRRPSVTDRSCAISVILQRPPFALPLLYQLLLARCAYRMHW
jgi:hypothetical protein